MIKDAAKWQVDSEKDASGFDEGYYGKLLEKAWEEVANLYSSHDWNDREQKPYTFPFKLL